MIRATNDVRDQRRRDENGEHIHNASVRVLHLRRYLVPVGILRFAHMEYSENSNDELETKVKREEFARAHAGGSEQLAWR